MVEEKIADLDDHMSDPGKKKALNVFSDMLMGLLSTIPSSKEAQSNDPKTRAQHITRTAAAKAAAVAGSLALPPGPLGLLTIVPDLAAIWRIQRGMVSDTAACYGKTASLTRESMLFCLFRHTAAQVVRDVVVRVGQRVLVRQAPLHIIQTMLMKIGVRILQRTAARAISRWLPIVGAAGIAGYAYWDTANVGKNAIDIFSREIEVGGR